MILCMFAAYKTFTSTETWCSHEPKYFFEEDSFRIAHASTQHNSFIKKVSPFRDENVHLV